MPLMGHRRVLRFLRFELIHHNIKNVKRNVRDVRFESVSHSAKVCPLLRPERIE